MTGFPNLPSGPIDRATSDAYADALLAAMVLAYWPPTGPQPPVLPPDVVQKFRDTIWMLVTMWGLATPGPIIPD